MKFLLIILNDLNSELRINKHKVEKLFIYRDRIKNINDLLAEEKLKVRALSEELENPKNI